MARRNSHYKKKKNLYIPIATIIIIGILGIQLIGLYSKLCGYEKKEALLREQLNDARTTEEELKEYEAYTQSDEFIKNTARSKLGLVGENEIVFKEK